MKIIHMTDTHILGDDSLLFGINPSDMLINAIKSIKRNHSDASFIAITGDLVHSGTFQAYKELKDLIKNIDIPIYLILGNHDKKDIFNKVFDLCKYDDFVQYQKIIDDKIFLFLDTVVLEEEYGTLCKKRLKLLENNLNKYKDKDVYIFMHHFPLESKINWMDKNAYFENKNIFWNIILKHNNVKHIFTGHLHKLINSNYKGVGVTCTKSTNFQLSYIPNSTKDYINANEEPSYNIILIEDGSLLIHNCEFNVEGKAFEVLQY